MKKAEKLEFEQLKNVSGGSGPTDEDVTAGVRAYCGNCQRSVLANRLCFPKLLSQTCYSRRSRLRFCTLSDRRLLVGCAGKEKDTSVSSVKTRWISILRDARKRKDIHQRESSAGSDFRYRGKVVVKNLSKISRLSHCHHRRRGAVFYKLNQRLSLQEINLRFV